MVEYLKEYFDFRALLICLGLVLVGLLSVYSATFDVGAAAAFKKQLLWSGFGLLALFTMAFIPVRTLQRISLPLYIFNLGLLLIGSHISRLPHFEKIRPPDLGEIKLIRV